MPKKCWLYRESLGNIPPRPNAIKGSLIEVVEKPGLKASIISGISDETLVSQTRGILSFPGRFRTESCYLNWIDTVKLIQEAFLCLFISRRNVRQHVIWSVMLSLTDIHLSDQREQMTRRSGVGKRSGLVGSPLSRWKIFLDRLASRHPDCHPTLPSPFLPSLPLSALLISVLVWSLRPAICHIFQVPAMPVARLPIKRNSTISYHGPIYKF